MCELNALGAAVVGNLLTCVAIGSIAWADILKLYSFREFQDKSLGLTQTQPHVVLKKKDHIVVSRV